MDCLEGMKQMEDNSVDLIVTDPPYNFEVVGGAFKSNNPSTNRKYLANLIDMGCGKFNPKDYFNEWLRITKESKMIIFCNKFLIDKYINLGRKHKLIWDIHIMAKRNPPPFKNKQFLNDIEYIMVFRKSGSYFNDKCGFNNFRKVFWTKCFQNNLHPAQKDINIIKKYLKIFSKENDLICDPFMGSGTTAVACKQLNRNFIGFELSKEYCNIANERLKQDNLKNWFTNQ